MSVENNGIVDIIEPPLRLHCELRSHFKTKTPLSRARFGQAVLSLQTFGVLMYFFSVLWILSDAFEVVEFPGYVFRFSCCRLMIRLMIWLLWSKLYRFKFDRNLNQSKNMKWKRSFQNTYRGGFFSESPSMYLWGLRDGKGSCR